MKPVVPFTVRLSVADVRVAPLRFAQGGSVGSIGGGQTHVVVNAPSGPSRVQIVLDGSGRKVLTGLMTEIAENAVEQRASYNEALAGSSR